MASYFFYGQEATDKTERKYRHISVIPFSVRAYAAIHYEERWKMDEGRLLENERKNKLK